MIGLRVDGPVPPSSIYLDGAIRAKVITRGWVCTRRLNVYQILSFSSTCAGPVDWDHTLT